MDATGGPTWPGGFGKPKLVGGKGVLVAVGPSVNGCSAHRLVEDVVEQRRVDGAPDRGRHRRDVVAGVRRLVIPSVIDPPSVPETPLGPPAVPGTVRMMSTVRR